MKKIVLSLVALGICVFGAMAQINTNGGFESTDAGAYDAEAVEGWSLECDGSEGVSAIFLVSEQEPIEGTKCMQIMVSGVGADPWSTQMTNENFTTENAVYYKFSVWAKCDVEGSTANFTIGRPADHATQPYGERGRIDAQALTTEWVQYNQIFFNDEDGLLRAPIHFLASDNYYIDGLVIKEGYLADAVVGTDGQSITLTMGWDLDAATVAAADAGTFAVTAGGATIAVTGLSQEEVDGEVANKKVVTLALESAITAGDEVSIAYTPGDLALASGEAVIAFDEAVANNAGGQGTSAIASANTFEFSIVPNPIQNEMTIFNHKQISEISIYNVLGSQIRNMKVNANSNVRIDVSDLEKGMYIISLSDNNGGKSTQKFLKN